MYTSKLGLCFLRLELCKVAEKLTKTQKEEGVMLDCLALDMDLESYVLAKKEKAVDNHFLGLMVELLNWEKNAPEVETSKKR